MGLFAFADEIRFWGYSLKKIYLFERPTQKGSSKHLYRNRTKIIKPAKYFVFLYEFQIRTMQNTNVGFSARNIDFVHLISLSSSRTAARYKINACWPLRETKNTLAGYNKWPQRPEIPHQKRWERRFLSGCGAPSNPAKPDIRPGCRKPELLALP